MVPARERLVNIGIRPSVNSIKMKRVVSQETRVCSFITRLINNQIKIWRKATSQKEENATTRMLWLLWKAYHSWVVYHRTRMHSFLKERKSFGETRCKKSWDQLEKYGSLSLRYVKSVSRKRNDHRLENFKSNLNISEVPTLQNSRTGPMKRLKDKSDVPEAGLGTLPKTDTSSKRTTKLHSTRLRKSGYSRLRQQTSRRQESDHEDIEESDDGDDGQRRGANKRRSDGKRQRIGLIRHSYASWWNSRSSFLGKTLRGSWVYIPLDQRSETTSHQKWQENWLRHIQLCTICGSWFISEFFLNNTFTYFSIIFITGFRIWRMQIHRKSGAKKEVEVWVDSFGETRCMKPQKPKKMVNQKEVQREISHELPDWLQEFRGPWGNPEQGTQDTSKSSHEFAMEPQWNQVRVSIVSTYTFRRTQIVMVQSCPKRIIVVIWLQRVAKFSVWISTQSSICRGGTRLGNTVHTIIPVQIKIFPGDPEEPNDVPEADEETISHYTDNSLEFGKSFEELSWNHSTSTPHRSETNGIAGRAMRRVKESTSAVLMQSGLGNEWWADSIECCCYLRNIQDLLSDWKTPCDRRFGMPFDGPVIPSGATVEKHQFCERPI